MKNPWPVQEAIDEAFLQANEIYAFLGVWSDKMLIENRDHLQKYARAVMRLLVDHADSLNIDRDSADVDEIIKG